MVLTSTVLSQPSDNFIRLQYDTLIFTYFNTDIEHIENTSTNLLSKYYLNGTISTVNTYDNTVTTVFTNGTTY